MSGRQKVQRFPVLFQSFSFLHQQLSHAFETALTDV